VQKLGEKDVELARGHTGLVKAHTEAARSCAVAKRASMGDAETLKANKVPPKADTGPVEVTLG